MRLLLSLLLILSPISGWSQVFPTPGPGMANKATGGGATQVIKDAIVASATFSAATTGSWTHTPVSGSITAVGVQCSWYGNSTDTAAAFTWTYGGTSMGSAAATATSNDGSGNFRSTGIWGLASPATGAQTVSWSTTGAALYMQCASFTVTGSSTSTTFDHVNQATGTTAAPQVACTSSSNGLVLGSVYNAGANAISEDTTTDPGQTSSFASTTIGGDRVKGSYQPTGAASVTMAWTAAAYTFWSASCADFKPGP